MSAPGKKPKSVLEVLRASDIEARRAKTDAAFEEVIADKAPAAASSSAATPASTKRAPEVKQSKPKKSSNPYMKRRKNPTTKRWEGCLYDALKHEHDRKACRERRWPFD